jgi:hypothetical protein
MADPRKSSSELLEMIERVRDREWGTAPVGVFDAVERVARLDKPQYRDGTSARSRYLLIIAATALAALEQEGITQMRQEANRAA